MTTDLNLLFFDKVTKYIALYLIDKHFSKTKPPIIAHTDDINTPKSILYVNSFHSKYGFSNMLVWIMFFYLTDYWSSDGADSLDALNGVIF